MSEEEKFKNVVKLFNLLSRFSAGTVHVFYQKEQQQQQQEQQKLWNKLPKETFN